MGDGRWDDLHTHLSPRGSATREGPGNNIQG